MKVWLLYKSEYDGGCNSWTTLYGIFQDKLLAEWRATEENTRVDDANVNYYVEEGEVNTLFLEDYVDLDSAEE